MSTIAFDEPRDSISDENIMSNDSNDHSEGSDLVLEELKVPEQHANLSLLQLLMLTCPALGIQIMWLLMMSYGTPYLISLGLSDSHAALVWLAGPLSGAIAQPIFGALSDQCRHPWGRRKPFILGGTVFVIFCLLFLACTPDLVYFFARLTGSKSDAGGVQVIVQACSVLSVYGLNIAMQPLQSGTRAFIIDTCPAHRQAQASAWSSRFSGLGSIFIYLWGFTTIPNWAPLLVGTEFKALIIIGIFALTTTVATCLMIREKSLSHKDNYQENEITARSFMKGLRHSLRALPPTTWKVCKIQFFAWLAWFPVLYFTSTYIYQTFIISEHVHLDPSEIGNSDRKLIEVARREGILACFYFASVAFATNLFLPLFVRQITSRSANTAKTNISDYDLSAPRITVFAIPLTRIWQLSHLLFAFCMFLTFFTYTVPVAALLVGVLGMSWGVAIWAPYALISTEISYLKQRRTSDHYFSLSSSANVEDSWRGREMQGGTAAIMGIHNMAISIPQILAALTCAGVFKLTEIMSLEDGAAWVFRVAGCAALIAAWMIDDNWQ